ncbi:hypothetical protein D3C76_1527950 [compost metagenome]
MLIPGHGDVAGASSLAEMKEYLGFIQDYAALAAKSGETVEYWLEKGVPAHYGDWSLPYVFEWNFRWLFKKLQPQ